MKILKIRFNHLNSLSTPDPNGFTIDLSQSPFKESGIFAITGLNGAGKSTILDAITMALYRRSARFIKGNELPKDMISYGQKSCWAEILIESHNVLYEIRTELKNIKEKTESDVKIINYQTSEILTTNSNDFDREIKDKLVGLDYNQFLKTILLAQGNFTAFLDATPGEKAEILSKITNGEIYKLLSIQCHEVNGEKKQLASNLKKEYEIIPVLSENEFAEKQLRMTNIEKNNYLFNEEVNRFGKEIQWLKDLAITYQDLNDKKNKHEIACNNLLDFQPDLDRLERHDKAYEFYHVLKTWEERQNEVQISKKSLAVKETILSSLQVKRAEAIQKRTEVHAHYQTIKQQWYEFEPKLIEAGKLETRIAEHENKRKILLEQFHETNKLKQKAETERENIFNQLGEQVRKLKISNEYLQEHITDKQLVHELSGIRLLEKQYTNECHELEHNLKNMLSQSVFSDNNELHLVDLDQRSKKLHNNIQELKNNSEKLLSGRTPDAWQKSIEAMRSEIQIVEVVGRLISNTDDERNTQTQIRNQLKTLEHKYNEIIAERNSLNKSLSLAEQEYKYLQDQLQWEKATASLSEQRNSLVEGQPCPLCGSTHHPYAISNEPVSQSKTSSRLESTEKHLKMLREQISQAMKSEGEINGKIQQQKENLTFSEAKLNQFLAQIEQENLNIGVSIQTNEYYNNYLNHLNDKLKAEEEPYEVYQKYQTTIQQMTEELIGLKDVINLKRQMEELNKQHESTFATLKQMLNPFDVNFEHLQHSKTWIDALEQRVKAFVNAENESKSVEKLIHEQEKMLHSKDAELNKFAQEIARITQEGKQIKEVTDKYKNNKFELIGKQSSQEIAEEWKKRLSDAEQAFKQADHAFQETDLEFGKKTAEYETLTDNHKKLNDSFAESDQALQSALKQLAIPDVVTLKSYFLFPNEVDTIRERQVKLVQEVKIGESACQEAVKKWEDLNNQALTSESLGNLEQKLIDLKESIATNQQELGGLRTQLAIDAENKLKQAKIYQQYEQATTDYKRWEQLNSLIGSSDGSRFQNFAQKITLGQLVDAANYHLVQLSKRYRIVSKKTDNPKELELEIEDLTQASNRRPTKGLSGGEKFLISLALALGLSDLAGSKAKIENLFIDEGFGTLDAQNLELALSVLDSLQSQGKMIGIISHIPSLNDRIPARIHVQRQGNGFSKILVE